MANMSSVFSISNLGRNIILTTMPAGTKLIAGNKPVSFVTAQQLQQLQQQGQATQVNSSDFTSSLLNKLKLVLHAKPYTCELTEYISLLQVRFQTVPAQQLQRTAASSPKSTVSTVVFSTAPSPKTNPDPQ